MRLHVIPEAFELIQSGRKTRDGRLGYPDIISIKEGDALDFWSRGFPCQEYRARVTEVLRHPAGTCFADVIDDENYLSLVPIVSSPAEAVSIYNRIYPVEKQRAFGVVLIGFEKAE